MAFRLGVVGAVADRHGQPVARLLEGRSATCFPQTPFLYLYLYLYWPLVAYRSRLDGIGMAFDGIDMPFGRYRFPSAMTLRQFNNGFVKIRLGIQRPVLKVDELRDENLSRRKAVQPVSKFGQVSFIYRLTDLERGQLKVQLDNPGIVAVVD